jgi:NAD(P)H-flavin reductase
MTQIEKTAELIGSISRKYKKPVFCSFIGGKLVSEGEKELNKLKVPSFLFPERAISAIGAMWKFKTQQLKILNEITDIGVLNTQILPDKSTEILRKACENDQKALDNLDANDVVSNAGIQTPATKIATDLKDALKFAADTGYPVALKLSSPGLLHKKQLGGVILGIKNAEQLENGWDTLERKVEYLGEDIKKQVRFQIQKEVPVGTEVLVGIKRDSTFGPVLLFGAGGELAELISDENLHLLPLDMNDIQQLVKESKICSALKGNEMDPSFSLDKLFKMIFDLSKIFEAALEIQELEINPIIVSINDVWAVDTKILLDPSKLKATGPKFNVATTIKTELLAGKVRYFEFEAEKPLSVQPGQYLSVKVSSTRINCYSVAGQTSSTRFNFLVDSTPGGPGSKFFEALKENDKITYLGPFGTFTLKQNDKSKNILFLATGTGVAPLKSMIDHLLNVKKTKQNIALYIGLTNFEDIFLKDYFDSLCAKHKNFTYQIAIFNKSDKWDGHVGFITTLLKNDFPDTSKCTAYLCGNKFMISDATKILLDNGCSAEKICFEKYEI